MNKVLSTIALCWVSCIVGYQFCSFRSGSAPVGSTVVGTKKLGPASSGECVRDPLVLVYNRIPKAGSTTLMKLAKDLAARNDFVMVTPEPYFNHSKVLRAIFDAIRTNRKTLIVNHFFFPEVLYAGKVSYMNIMRDPVNRTLSDFYYLRYSKRRGNHAVSYRKRYGDISIDECYFGKTEYSDICEPPADFQASFFCGMEGHSCHNDTDQKEALGLDNMQQHYRVGVEERYEETLEMLELSYPGFFKGMSSMYAGMAKTSLNANKHPTASRHVMDHLKDLNRVDYTLYSKANKRLTSYLRQCKYL